MKKILGFIILVILIVIITGRYFFPAISLKTPAKHDLYLVENKKLIIEDGVNIRNFLAIGEYYIYYQTNEFNRFYAKIILKPWNNTLSPNYKLYPLPARQYQIKFGKKMNFSHHDDVKYITSDGDRDKLALNYDISINYKDATDKSFTTIQYQINYLGKKTFFSDKIPLKDGIPKRTQNFKYTLSDYKIFRIYLKVRINEGLLYLTPSLEYK